MKSILYWVTGGLLCLSVIACQEDAPDAVAGLGTPAACFTDFAFHQAQSNGACRGVNFTGNLNGINCNNGATAALNPTVCGTNNNNVCFNISNCQNNQVYIPDQNNATCSTIPGRSTAYDSYPT